MEHELSEQYLHSYEEVKIWHDEGWASKTNSSFGAETIFRQDDDERKS